MLQITKLPSDFERYRKMGGVLDFAVFEDANGCNDEILSSIPIAISSKYAFHRDQLLELGCRRISERALFGEWYDYNGGNLLKLGSHLTANGHELIDPTLKSLDKVTITSGAGPIPEAGSGGQFAYAFSQPPYGMSGRPSETQSIFESVRDFILPPQQPSIISDWSSPKLPRVSDYFDAGAEWWGMFLFAVYVPAIRKLTIIAGSTTD